ncbi:unnamed protein product [Durusdinium trenchii]|uniref:Alcohol dehydrogenase-like C-terminal domain-containing protein n=1 Tax=Durusdinium trenchii TaxID=1381693 RepID=A0ABP0IA85_9DINO
MAHSSHTSTPCDTSKPVSFRFKMWNGFHIFSGSFSQPPLTQEGPWLLRGGQRRHCQEGYLEKSLEAVPSGFDVILEMAGHANLPADLRLAGQNGRICIVGSKSADVSINPRALMPKQIDVRGVFLGSASAEELKEVHAALFDAMNRRALVPVVSLQIPLAEAAKAHVEEPKKLKALESSEGGSFEGKSGRRRRRHGHGAPGGPAVYGGPDGPGPGPAHGGEGIAGGKGHAGGPTKGKGNGKGSAFLEKRSYDGPKVNMDEQPFGNASTLEEPKKLKALESSEGGSFEGKSGRRRRRHGHGAPGGPAVYGGPDGPGPGPAHGGEGIAGGKGHAGGPTKGKGKGKGSAFLEKRSYDRAEVNTTMMDQQP